MLKIVPKVRSLDLIDRQYTNLVFSQKTMFRYTMRLEALDKICLRTVNDLVHTIEYAMRFKLEILCQPPPEGLVMEYACQKLHASTAHHVNFMAQLKIMTGGKNNFH